MFIKVDTLSTNNQPSNSEVICELCLGSIKPILTPVIGIGYTDEADWSNPTSNVKMALSLIEFIII